MLYGHIIHFSHVGLQWTVYPAKPLKYSVFILDLICIGWFPGDLNVSWLPHDYKYFQKHFSATLSSLASGLSGGKTCDPVSGQVLRWLEQRYLFELNGSPLDTLALPGLTQLNAN